MGFLDALFGKSASKEPAKAPEPRVVPPGVAAGYAEENARIAPLVSNVLAELGRSLRPGDRTPPRCEARPEDARIPRLPRRDRDTLAA